MEVIFNRYRMEASGERPGRRVFFMKGVICDKEK